MTTDAHSRTSADIPAPLYDEAVPTPTHAERARTMAEAITTGTLSTLALDPLGHPYGSFVTAALDGGHPVFLISELAEHTKNLRQDGRASMMLAEGGAEDALANGRVTLVGHCAQVADPGGQARDIYLRAHPNASYYADFKDFHFWKLTVESLRYIGGYGRMSWVPIGEWLNAQPDPLAPEAQAIIDHMNADHADALVAYCHAFSRATATPRAVMTGVDQYGFEMSVETEDGPRPVRLGFSKPVANATETRQALIALLKQARAKLAPR